MTYFIKVSGNGLYGGEVHTAGEETTLAAAEPDAVYIPGAGRPDGPWEGKVYDRDSDSWSDPPGPDVTATIVVYGSDIDTPKSQFDVGDTVNIRVTLSAQLNRSIAVPIDRLDAAGNLIEPAVLWLKLALVSGVGTISKVFNTPGRYGVGPSTSQEFSVPETIITVFS